MQCRPPALVERQAKTRTTPGSNVSERLGQAVDRSHLFWARHTISRIGSRRRGRGRYRVQSVGSRLLAIGGGSCAGKTSVARAVEAALGSRCVLLPLDAYFRHRPDLSLAQRAEINYDEPAVIDSDLLYKQLDALVAGFSIERPQYDFPTRLRAGSTHVDPREIVILEGHLCLALEGVRTRSWRLAFVDAPDQVRLDRRIVRDTSERGRTRESILRQWEASVNSMHEARILPSRRHAHLLLDGTVSPERNAAKIVTILTGDRPTQLIAPRW